MDFREKLEALTEREYFVRGLIVFPNAYVEAKLGSTQQVHCVRNETLIDYLTDQKFTHNLLAAEIGDAKRARLQLA